MEHSPCCPQCCSRYANIRGLLYSPGQVVGTQCPDIWHRGADYDPDKWVLSEFDTEFLAEQHISPR